MSNIDKLKGAFVEALGIDPASSFDGLAYGTTTGWDSMAHMTLIVTIEKAFDIMLPTDDVIDMSSFSKAKEIVGKHGVSI